MFVVELFWYLGRGRWKIATASSRPTFFPGRNMIAIINHLTIEM